ncbi:MAG: DUF1801 domain-containing protein [Gammaproteobacteria bacterium]
MAKTNSTTGVKPQKMKAYPSFAAWKHDQSSENQRLINALSRLVKKTAPEFAPAVKWGQGCWTLNGAPKVYIHTEPDHVQFGFYAGSKLRDPEALLVGSGKHVRHVKVFTTKGIPRKSLVDLLEQVL